MTYKDLVNGLMRSIASLDAYFHEHNVTVDEQWAKDDYHLIRAAAKAYADIIQECLIKDEEEKKYHEHE